MVFQEIALISEFTVAENIFLEGYPTNKAGSIRWNTIRKDAAALFDRIGFNVDPSAKVGSLPVSKQQMVEIARALAQEARIVVMDEPTSSLTPTEVSLLFDVIRRLTSIGIAVLYVSHKLDEIFEIADTVTVLRDGRHISTKPIGEHTNDTLIQDMIGRRIENLFPRSRGTARDEVILKVEDLSTDAKLKNVSFEAKAGEVLGFFGLMGAGRTELAKAIVGFDPIRTGRIAIGGAPLSPHNTRVGKALGIGLLTEDRKNEGLMLELPVLQNTSLASLESFAQRWLRRRGQGAKRRAGLCRSLPGEDAEPRPADQVPFRRQPAESAAGPLADARPQGHRRRRADPRHRRRRQVGDFRADRPARGRRPRGRHDDLGDARAARPFGPHRGHGRGPASPP